MPPPRRRPVGAPFASRRRVAKSSGHTLARRLSGKTKTQKALLLEELDRRGYALVNLTTKQWAVLGGISTVMLHAATKLDMVDRAEVHDGLRPLIQSTKPNPFSPKVDDAWATAKKLVDEFGPATVFDRVICPTL